MKTTNTTNKLHLVVTRRKAMLLKLKDAEQKLRQNKSIKSSQVGVAKPRELPRGVLTLAILHEIGHRQLTVPEIVEKLTPKFKKVSGLRHKINCLLSASTRFKRVTRGIYTSNGGIPESHLFKRLDNKLILV